MSDLRIDVHVHFDQPASDPRLDQVLKLLGVQSTQLTALHVGQEKTMALVTVQDTDIKAVVDGIATLKTDTSKSLADIKAKLDAGATVTEDPAAKALLQGAAADVAALDAQITAADPGVITPVGGTEQP